MLYYPKFVGEFAQDGGHVSERGWRSCVGYTHSHPLTHTLSLSLAHSVDGDSGRSQVDGRDKQQSRGT